MNQFTFRTPVENHEYIVYWHIAKPMYSEIVIIDKMVRDTLRFIDTPHYGTLSSECGTIKDFKIYENAIADGKIVLDGIKAKQYEPHHNYGFEYLEVENTKAVMDFVTYTLNNQKCHNRLGLLISKYQKGKLSPRAFYVEFAQHIRKSWQEYYYEDLKEKGRMFSLFSKPDLVSIRKQICDRISDFDLETNLNLARQTYECSVWNCETEEEDFVMYSKEFSLSDAHAYFKNHSAIREYIGSPLHTIDFTLSQSIKIQESDYIRTTG